MDLNRYLRNINKEARERAEADKPARAIRLAPEVVSHWTKLVKRATPFVVPGRATCDYGPWIRALRRARGLPNSDAGTMPYTDFYYAERYPELMSFASDAAHPSWPLQRPDLVEFALCFLEADVMLFRSGYAKRHLSKRLQQSALTDDQVARIDAILRRAVLQGAGLEEFGAYSKLAAQLVVAQRLPGLREWLEGRAQGAIVTCDHMRGSDFVRFISNSELSEKDQLRLAGGYGIGRRKLGLVWPEMNAIVRADDPEIPGDPRQRRNAYFMLRAIQRRESSWPG